MSASSETRYPITSCSIGSPISYSIRGEYLEGRLFGLIPVSNIHLSAVYYLRLASHSDATPIFLCFNWIHFMPHKRSIRPVYILQTRSRHRCFLKLNGTNHFKLRQAIAKHCMRHDHMAA